MSFVDSGPSSWELFLVDPLLGFNDSAASVWVNFTIDAEIVPPDGELIDSDPSEWAVFTFPPEAGLTNSFPSDWATFMIDPDGGWEDSNPSAWATFSIPAAGVSNGLFMIDASDAVVPVELVDVGDL